VLHGGACPKRGPQLLTGGQPTNSHREPHRDGLVGQALEQLKLRVRGRRGQRLRRRSSGSGGSGSRHGVGHREHKPHGRVGRGDWDSMAGGGMHPSRCHGGPGIDARQSHDDAAAAQLEMY
jgi:hypothetical protein